MVSVKGGQGYGLGVLVLVGVAPYGKTTLVWGAVAVAAVELPLICFGNSINNFGVNPVFKKEANFSKTHIETYVQIQYKSNKNNEKSLVIENLPNISIPLA